MRVPPMRMERAEIRAELDRIRHPFRVAIDRAKNPFNIGAIIRTAHSFLAREILLIGTEPWYLRAAMGMQRYEHVVEIESTDAFLERAAQEGWKLFSFEKDSKQVENLWDVTLPEDAVLVFGNEDDGLSEKVLAASEKVLAIPMFGINHSYPVAVAAGIGMSEWARQYYAGGRTIVPMPSP